MVFVPLLGGAVFTARRSGPGGERQLFSGVFRWRIGWRYWAPRVVVMPLITVTIAAAAGTLASPPEGWLTTATDYLVATFLVGTLVINLWAETSWQGLVQRHLTAGCGLARGALLTAVPFIWHPSAHRSCRRAAFELVVVEASGTAERRCPARHATLRTSGSAREDRQLQVADRPARPAGPLGPTSRADGSSSRALSQPAYRIVGIINQSTTATNAAIFNQNVMVSRDRDSAGFSTRDDTRSFPR